MPATVKILTADVAISEAQDDVVCIMDAADLVVTLPKSRSASVGNRVTVTVSTLSTVTGAQIAPRAGEFIRGHGITASASKKLINTAASDAVGDTTELVSDGTGSWWIVNQLGTWAREA